MKILKVTRKVYEQYKKEVTGSANETLMQVRLKMTRNKELSKTHIRTCGKSTFHEYGKLHFIVSRDGTVVWMKNRCAIPEGWKRDNKRFIELNKELGIENGISEMGLTVRDTFMESYSGVDYNGIKWIEGNKVVVERRSELVTL